ncbi:MAG: ATPase, T2SS/T4P/T4SS family [Adlercreutzia equolifaciens]
MITIEDAAGLKFDEHRHVRCALEARAPNNAEGTGEAILTELAVKRPAHEPDRIIVGGMRGSDEAHRHMLQAMSTGHDGIARCDAALPQSPPREAVERLVNHGAVRRGAKPPDATGGAVIGNALRSDPCRRRAVLGALGRDLRDSPRQSFDHGHAAPLRRSHAVPVGSGPGSRAFGRTVPQWVDRLAPAGLADIDGR